jgi:phosphoglycerol transferase MdoB-like AlkP superfamily enzyme
MRVWLWLPRIFRLALAAVLAELVLFTALRAVFFGVFAKHAGVWTAGELARAFYIGGKLDLRLAIFTVLPLLLLGWIGPVDPFERRVGKTLWGSLLAVELVTVLLGYFADLGHFGYLETRLNASVLQYIEDPRISGRMIWETYPVGWGLLALALTAMAVWLSFGVLLRWSALATPSPLAGWRRAVAGTLAACLVLAGIYGKASWYPLRWSDAYFSTNDFISALGLNPILQFVETLNVQAEKYDIAKVRSGYDLVADYLGVQSPDRDHLVFTRSERPRQVVTRPRPNVVIILLESFATSRVGIFGDPLKPTPAFDSMAPNGILFTHFYTPSHGTSRSVFTLLTGIPDVAGAETSSQNPLLVRQRTVVNAFEGYRKLYFLGGSANWGNIRGLLSHNIPGLELFEEGSYKAPRADVWGIDDLHLFEEANQKLRDVSEPFFAIIQTSGHHRPYTIPKDSRGFQRVTVADDALRRSGFVELDELNSFRFLDFCLGFFMDEARRERYFDNTVFVMLGDHGLPRTGANLPPGEWDLALVRFHVPLLIYAPTLLPEGRRVDTVTSEVDVLPTLASLLGIPYTTATLGRDALDPRFGASHYAFTMTDQFHIPEIGLLGSDFYLRMPRAGGVATLHDLHSVNPVRDVAVEHPDVAARMKRLCESLFETAKYMLRHNAPDGGTVPGRPEASRP